MQTKTIQLTAILVPQPDGSFIATNPETQTCTQGDTLDEALANLREATALYLEEFRIVTDQKPLLTTINVALRAS